MVHEDLTFICGTSDNCSFYVKVDSLFNIRDEKLRPSSFIKVLKSSSFSCLHLVQTTTVSSIRFQTHDKPKHSGIKSSVLGSRFYIR